MYKYKDKYVFRYSRDYDGNIYNRDDNYLVCNSGGQIYRYDGTTLIFISYKQIRIKKVDKETKKVEYDYSKLILDLYDTDAERVITFKEENFDKLKKLFKVRKKRKMTESQKEAAKIRLAEIRKKNQEFAINGKENEMIDDDIKYSIKRAIF